MTVLTFGNRLSARSWIAGLLRLGHSPIPRPATTDRPRKLEIELDLSTVGFADFIILGHVLIYVDAMTKQGWNVTVRLPNGDPLSSESISPVSADYDAAPTATYLHQQARKQALRHNCRIFMKQSGFEQALRTNWPNSLLKVVEGEEFARESQPGSGPADEGLIEDPQPPHRLRKILPYHWITFSQDKATWGSHSATLEVALNGLGLSSEDSANLAHDVLAELIENVAEHSNDETVGPVRALVGAAIIDPGSYRARVDDFNPALRGFARWASENQSPLIRLLVADSGRGLATSLSETKHLHGRRSQATEPSRNLTDGQDTILYAIERWSTSNDVESAIRRGARGLWKVGRIVRSYQGSIFITTGIDSAGLVYAESPEGSPVTGQPDVWIPGTIVECNILNHRDGGILHAREEVPSPSVSKTGDGHNLQCMSLSLQVGEGLTQHDLQMVEETLAELPTRATHGLVIVIETTNGRESPDDGQIRESLREVLDLASEASNPATVTLAFPSINRRLLSLAVEDLNTEHDSGNLRDARRLRNPILVVAPQNKHYWAGGTPAVRELLRSLSSAQGPLQLADILASDRDRAITLRQIRDQTGLLRIDSDHVSLRLRPQDALDALIRHLKSKIEHAIESGQSPGVRVGTFLTPSLRPTTRWCNANEILRHLGSERLAGFALAALVEERVGRLDEVPEKAPPLILVGSLSHGLMTTLGRSLLGTDVYFENLDTLRLDRGLIGQGDQRKVVIVTDLISTGSTLARTVSALAARGVSPVAIAAVVDARDHGLSVRDEVVIDSLSIPTVSLANVNIKAPADGQVPTELTPIDPVLEWPTAIGSPQPKALVLQPLYLEVLARTSAARLGHIHRPAGRHYTAYVDPTVLFRDPAWATHTIDLLCRKVIESRAVGIGGKEKELGVCIVLPRETTDDLANVAKLLGDSLAKQYVPVSGILQVPRATLTTKWLFPSSVPFPEGTGHVVLLDSGTGTGGTIHQLIRIGASPGIKAITAIVLLNGLGDLEALALQQIRTVMSISDSRRDGREIPVRLHFLVRTAMSSLDARDCPVCMLRRRYDELPLHLPPRISEQRDWVLASLAPRSKGKAFEEEATDLLGTPLSQEDCIEYLRWKFNLREAMVDTHARYRVVEDIHTISTDLRRRDALVRLLTAERQWLGLAPLRFPEVRREVVSVVASLVLGDAALSVDPALRGQAVILLADADPDYFVDRLKSIALSNLGEKLVIGQVLLETLLLLTNSERPWSWFDRTIDNLTSLEDELRARRREDAAWTAPAPLEEIRHIISIGRRTLRPSPSDPQDAWAALRRYRLSVSEHQFDAAIWRIDVTLGNILRGVHPRDAESVQDDWQKCVDFLCADVLPNLVAVRLPLLNARFTKRFGPKDAARWTRVVNGFGFAQLDETTARLSTLLGMGRDADGRLIEDILSDLRWWSRFFLAAHADPGRSAESAVLTEIVRRCPATLFRTIGSVFEGSNYELVLDNVTDDESLQVFCPDAFLKDIFSHIRMNAEVTHRTPGEPCLIQITVRDLVPGILDVRIDNTGSSASQEGGSGGLDTLASELKQFGGMLNVVDQVQDPWTFGVSVSLERWRAG